MRVQRYALFPTPANLEGNFSPITTFLLHTPCRGAMTETWTESPHAEPRARVISQGHIEKPHGQQGCLDWLPLPVSRNHPETIPKLCQLPWREKADTVPQSSRTRQRQSHRSEPQSQAFQCFSVSIKKSMPHYSLLPISPYLNFTIYTYYRD